jgi:hypothetical protein
VSDEPPRNDPSSEMVTIRLVDYPVALANRAGRHYEAIQREFALIHFSDDATKASVPARLLEVAERTHATLESGEIIDREQVETSIEQGTGTITVDLRMPRAAGVVMAELVGLLVEADDFCRDGDLITVAMPPECREFREWFLGEFSRQADGEPPIPWTGALE